MSGVGFEGGEVGSQGAGAVGRVTAGPVLAVVVVAVLRVVAGWIARAGLAVVGREVSAEFGDFGADLGDGGFVVGGAQHSRGELGDLRHLV